MKRLLAICAAYVFGPQLSDSMHLAHMYLPSGIYVVGSRETGRVEPLLIEYSGQSMIWRFQGATFELIDDGTLRSFRAMTLPLEKESSRDPIQILQLRSTSERSTYVQVIYNEDERPYFLEFETNGFVFQGWIKRK